MDGNITADINTYMKNISLFDESKLYIIWNYALSKYNIGAGAVFCSVGQTSFDSIFHSAALKTKA